LANYLYFSVNKKKTRRIGLGKFIFIFLLFISGILFCSYILYPPSFKLSKVRYISRILPSEEVSISEEIPYRQLNVETFRNQFTTLGHSILLNEEELYNFFVMAEYFGKKWGISLDIYLTFASIESDFRTSALSNKNCKGIFQISQICLDQYNSYNGFTYNHDDMYTMWSAFEVMSWYIRWLLERDIVENHFQAYTAYNVGIGNYYRYKRSYNLGLFPDGRSYMVKDKYHIVHKDVNLALEASYK
jgi:hypothetical protein